MSLLSVSCFSRKQNSHDPLSVSYELNVSDFGLMFLVTVFGCSLNVCFGTIKNIFIYHIIMSFRYIK